MKLQFKHQKFQADAAKAVVDVFAGQPYLTPTYMMDRGYGQQTMTDDADFTGWRNERIVPELSDKLILEHLQKVQRTNQIKPSAATFNLLSCCIMQVNLLQKLFCFLHDLHKSPSFVF